MGRDDWYRRTTWTEDDRTEFFARLKRCRSIDSKVQYLRIQASYLADAGKHGEALELLDQLIRDHPVESQLAQANLQKAQALAGMVRDDETVEAFRECLRAERRWPTFRTAGWVEFAWFVAWREKRELFDEALAVLAEFKSTGSAIGLMFPAGRFKYQGALALMAAACGESERAREFAQRALESAAATDSSFRYHPGFGLVGTLDAGVRARLEAIAGL